jgi:hypothetical protein
LTYFLCHVEKSSVTIARDVPADYVAEAPWVVLSADELAEHERLAMPHVRRERDERLTASDWTQMADSPLSESHRAAWATYRQALRDLPSVYSGEGPIPWPQEPA